MTIYLTRTKELISIAIILMLKSLLWLKQSGITGTIVFLMAMDGLMMGCLVWVGYLAEKVALVEAVIGISQHSIPPIDSPVR